jgi:hypothetical protein
VDGIALLAELALELRYRAGMESSSKTAGKQGRVQLLSPEKQFQTGLKAG